MQFHKADRPTPYLNGRDQRRLLLMVATLAAVIWGIDFAARPAHWYWLTGGPAANDAAAQAPPEKSIDARLDPEEERLPPGGFRVTGPPVTDPVQDKPGAVDDVARLDPALLSVVSDNSLGIRNSEREAYYRILAQARAVPEQQLESAAADDVTFAQMYTDPDDYRGRLVTIRGSVKQLTPLAALENEYGIETVYEAWIVTPDSGNNPLVLHFTEIPQGMPVGTKLDLSCRFTGYFFKKYAYETLDGPHSTTMLLGQRLIWRRPPTAPPETGLAAYILGLAAVMGMIVGVAVWRQSAGDRRFRRAYLDRIQQASHASPVELDTAVPEAGEDEDTLPAES